jgi:hypothetical protein
MVIIRINPTKPALESLLPPRISHEYEVTQRLHGESRRLTLSCGIGRYSTAEEMHLYRHKVASVRYHQYRVSVL